MIIRKNHEIEGSKWKAILKKSDYSNPFQCQAFYDLYNRQKYYCSDVFAIEKNNEYTCLIVVTLQKELGLKAFFSKRAIVYGGPIIVDNDVEGLSYLIKFIIKYYKTKSIYLEIRNYLDYSLYHPVFSQNKFDFLPYLNYTLPIKGKTMEEILKKMNYNRRREIRLTLKNDAIFKELSSKQELVELYNILHNTYKDRVKLPIPSLDFFKDLSETTIGKIFIVKHNQKVIGGSICFSLENQAIYTMYYCGIREYQKKIYPSHLSILATIEYSLRNDLKYVDLMGAGIKGNKYGVRAYKQQFGGELNEYGRYRLILKPYFFKIGLIGLKYMRKIRL